jgi:hypothetical protein
MPKEESENKKQSNSEQWRNRLMSIILFVCVLLLVRINQQARMGSTTRPIQAPVRVKVKQAKRQTDMPIQPAQRNAI